MGILYRRHSLHPESVLIRDFVGEISADEIINSWEILLEQGMLDLQLKGVINNLSGCELKMNFESFNKLMGFMKNNEILRRIKLAVVCDSPQNIVFPVLGEEEPELQIKAFSTSKNAEAWIMGV